MAQWQRILPIQATQVQFHSGEDSLEEGMATHSSILAWRIPRTEKPGGLQSRGSQRVRLDLVTETTDNRNHREDYRAGSETGSQERKVKVKGQHSGAGQGEGLL